MVMAASELVWQSPVAVLGLSAVTSVVAFVVYGVDKTAARQGARRIPENTLHLLALLGGWPGGLLAQKVFRHKTRKLSFQIVFWITVVLNCAALTLALSSFGPNLFPKASEASADMRGETEDKVSDLPKVTPGPRSRKSR